MKFYPFYKIFIPNFHFLKIPGNPQAKINKFQKVEKYNLYVQFRKTMYSKSKKQNNDFNLATVAPNRK